MAFIVCGLNYKTAPLSIRENFTRHITSAFNLSDSPKHDEILGVVYLSTCNRTEIYCEAQTIEQALTYFATLHQQDIQTLTPFLYAHTERDALVHAIRVASGLDSMMIGEPQIFGQLKQSVQEAETRQQLNPKLNRQFQFIFSAAKKIRHQSGIGDNPISVASVAAQFIKTHRNDIPSLKVLIIGSGETAHLVSKYLYQMGIRKFFVASRTQENALKLASAFDATVVNITEIPNYLKITDIVITATACPVPFITFNMASEAAQSRTTPLMMLDLAVPRDIEPHVGSIQGIQLINIDDLHIQIEQGLEARKDAAQKAEQLLQNEIESFTIKDRTLLAKEVICDYRNLMQEIADFELSRAQNKLAQGEKAPQILKEFSQRLVNKLTHVPTLGLKQAAIEGRDELLDLAEFLFQSDDRQRRYE